MRVDDYLSRAAEFTARAEREVDAGRRGELESSVRAFLRLAVLAQGNAGFDAIDKPPPPKPGD